MRPRRRALSLLEVLCVTAVLGLFMTMVCHGLVVGYRSHVYTTERSQAYREATVVLARMVREISTCNRWISPPPGSLSALTPSRTLKFRRNDRDSAAGVGAGTEVEYWLDPDTRELWTTDLEHPQGRRVAARNIRSFTVEVDEPVVRLVLTVKGVEQPLRMEIQAPRL